MLFAPPIFFARAAIFVGFTQDIVFTSTAQTEDIAVPAGASLLTAECIGFGGNGQWRGDLEAAFGGGGAAYSRTENYALTGIFNLHLRNWASLHEVRHSNAGGVIICAAQNGSSNPPFGTGTGAPGGQAASGIGDVKYSGETGAVGFNFSVARGGRAAGYSGVGSAPGGDGGWFSPGQPYGGGGFGGTSAAQSTVGGPALVKLTWS